MNVISRVLLITQITSIILNTPDISFLSPKVSVLWSSMMKELDLIVTKVEIEYKYPLRSRDEFFVTVNIRREGNARIAFSSGDLQVTRFKADCKGKSNRGGY